MLLIIFQPKSLHPKKGAVLENSTLTLLIINLIFPLFSPHPSIKRPFSQNIIYLYS